MKAQPITINRYKEQLHNYEYEKMYRKVYLRLHNRKLKLINEGFSCKEIYPFTIRFALFQEEMAYQKKRGSYLEDFSTWLEQKEATLKKVADDIESSREHKKLKSPEKYTRYKERHNNEFEAEYMKVYQRWYTRIRRIREKGQISEDDLLNLYSKFTEFTNGSYDMRSDAQSGKIPPKEFSRWLDDFEMQMNVLLNTLKERRDVNEKM